MGFSFIPTPEVGDPREQNDTWRRVVELKPGDRDIARELFKYHSLLTSGIELPPLSSEVAAEGVLELLTTGSDKSPSLSSSDEQELAFRSVFEGQRLRKIEVGETRKVGGVRYTYSPLVLGALRQWGKRECHDGITTEPIFSGVSFDVRVKGEARHYMAPQDGLDRVFRAFADRSDELFAQARSEDEKLFAIAFTQLWGVSVIHPFFGANRRAFEAQMGADLARMGYPTDGPLRSETGRGLLANRGADFLEIFLLESHINPPTRDRLLKFDRRTYFKVLSRTILDDMTHRNTAKTRELNKCITKATKMIQKKIKS